MCNPLCEKCKYSLVEYHLDEANFSSYDAPVQAKAVYYCKYKAIIQKALDNNRAGRTNDLFKVGTIAGGGCTHIVKRVDDCLETCDKFKEEN